MANILHMYLDYMNYLQSFGAEGLFIFTMSTHHLQGTNRLSAAEKQRRYRARRDADSERRETYLKKEQQKYWEDIASGKKKTVSNISEEEKRIRRKKWRETYHRIKSRKETLKHPNTPPASPQRSYGKGVPDGVRHVLKGTVDSLISNGPDSSELFSVMNKTVTTKCCFVKEEAVNRPVSEMTMDMTPVSSMTAGKVGQPVK